MSYIKADSPREQEYFDYLEELRQSGETNMFGARPYLSAAFGELGSVEAGNVLCKWMNGHSNPALRLDGPTSKTRTKVITATKIKVSKTRR